MGRVGGIPPTTVTGADPAAAYYQAAASADNTNELVLGRSLHLADRPPLVAGPYTEEFEGTADALPTGWAWFGAAPSGADALHVNSKFPSLFSVSGTAAATYVLERTIAPGASDSFGIFVCVYMSPHAAADVPKFRLQIGNDDFSEVRTAEFYVSALNAVNIRGLRTALTLEATAWGVASPGRPLPAATSKLYIGLKRTNADSWQLVYSLDGIAYHRYAAAELHAFTVGRVRLQFGTASYDSMVGLDWLRHREDAGYPWPVG